MFHPTSATEAAFLIIALIQGVFALLWLASAAAISARSPLVHWAVWASLSAATWLILSVRLDSPPLAGVLAGVAGVMMLGRGVRLFVGGRPRDTTHAFLFAAVIAAHVLFALPERVHLQAVVNYGALAWLYFDVARDVFGYAREHLRWRFSGVLAIPVGLGALICLQRAVTALADPAAVASALAADSALNVRTGLLTVALIITWHATLVSLVVTRLVSELHRLSRHDALTGLLNRRAMEEQLHAQLDMSRRTNETFTVLMLDLDNFKRINDQHGHATGDEALKHTALVLKKALRPIDSLARFGGEEFVLLTRGLGLDQAGDLAETLRALLHHSPLVRDGASVALSVSVGAAQWRGPGDDASRLLSRADAALFRAKIQGRNCVVLDAA